MKRLQLISILIIITGLLVSCGSLDPKQQEYDIRLQLTPGDVFVVKQISTQKTEMLLFGQNINMLTTIEYDFLYTIKEKTTQNNYIFETTYTDVKMSFEDSNREEPLIESEEY